MKAKDIKVGGHYTAKIAGNLTTVRVDAIRQRYTNSRGQSCCRDHYDVTNLRTGRKTTFRSAAKFRYEVKPTYRGDDAAKIREAAGLPAK